MKTLKLIIFSLFILTLSVHGAMCQNSEFDKLATEFKTTRVTQDSLQTLVTKYRQQLQNDPSKQEELTSKIISTEDRLYEVNSRISKISARVLEIDPSGARNLIESFRPSAPPVQQSGTLIDNQILKTLLSDKDIALIRNSAAVEKQVGTLKESIRDQYLQLVNIKKVYDKSMSSVEIDSLMSESLRIKQKIHDADDQINKIWDPIFDKKIETYLIIADKIGIDRQQLEVVDEYFRNVRRAEADCENQIAPNALLFNSQRALVLQYELMLVKNLSLNDAKAAITKQIAALDDDVVNLPDIDLEYRSLIVYSKVFNDGAYDFVGIENIPQQEIPKNGIYYAVQIYSLQNKVKSLDTFKKIRPLRITRNSAGIHLYVVGGFKKYAEAQAAVTQIYSKFGYRSGNVLMLAWVDGKMSTPAKAKVIQEAYDKENSGRFKIEVTTQNTSLISSLRAVVDQFEEGKQITRILQGNETIFTILEFDDKLQAEELAEILSTKDKTKVEIIKIEEK